MATTLAQKSAFLGFPDPKDCPWHEYWHHHVAAFRVPSSPTDMRRSNLGHTICFKPEPACSTAQ